LIEFFLASNGPGKNPLMFFFLGLFVFPYPARSSERLSQIFTHIWLRIGTLEFNFEHCSAICGAGVGTDVVGVVVVVVVVVVPFPGRD
jgi:hydrogenase-4 membrane subunit HyfE